MSLVPYSSDRAILRFPWKEASSAKPQSPLRWELPVEAGLSARGVGAAPSTLGPEEEMQREEGQVTLPDPAGFKQTK